MPSAVVTVETGITKSARLVQLSSIFDVELQEKSKISWNVDLPIDEKPWNIGLIVGASGCGKSTIGMHFFGEPIQNHWDNRSIVDNFPEDMGINEITKFLTSLGL